MEHNCRSNTDFSSLPDEILQNVLARLPVIQMLRSRLVCRRWNRVASSDWSPVRHPRRSGQSRPGFAVFLTSEKTSRMLHLDLNDASKWRALPLDFLPERGSNLRLLASASGLLLLGTPAGELLVANPVSKSWVQLPPRALVRDPFYCAMAGPDEEEEENGFVVVLAESEMRERAATEVYRSKTGTWQAAAGPSRAGRWNRVAASISLPWSSGSVNVSCKPAYSQGAFYHLTWDPLDTVAALALAPTATWRCNSGPGAIPGNGVPWGLMRCGPKILLVEMSYPKSEETHTSSDTTLACDTTKPIPSNYDSNAYLFLWELHPDTLKWKPIGYVPNPPDPSLCIDKWRRFALGDGYIYTTFIIPNTIVSFGSPSCTQRGMIFDVQSCTWLPTPDLPGTPWGHISSLFNFSASFYQPANLQSKCQSCCNSNRFGGPSKYNGDILLCKKALYFLPSTY